MAATLANDNSKCIFLNENDRIPIRMSLIFVPRSQIHDKPLPEPMPTQFTDAYRPLYGTRGRRVHSFSNVYFG